MYACLICQVPCDSDHAGYLIDDDINEMLVRPVKQVRAMRTTHLLVSTGVRKTNLLVSTGAYNKSKSINRRAVIFLLSSFFLSFLLFLICPLSLPFFALSLSLSISVFLRGRVYTCTGWFQINSQTLDYFCNLLHPGSRVGYLGLRF